MAATGLEEARAQADAGASPWQDAPHSRIRMLSTTGLYYQGKPVLAAAIEIALEPGWKTYWRSPGEGLPPILDWTKSGNLGSANLLWPAPSRFEEAEGAYAAGYRGRVLLPVLINATDAALPISLKLAISYNVCNDICVPDEATLQLEIPAGPHEAHRDLIGAALDTVPKAQEQGIYCPHSFVAAVRRLVNGRPALVIKTAFDERATGLDLFVEGPEGHALPVPSAQPASTRGRSHYVMFFDTQAAVDDLLNKTLTFTSVSDQGSCESFWRVK
jgi:DsbC/DsbD-like thiol-disulfide interchange protein